LNFYFICFSIYKHILFFFLTEPEIIFEDDILFLEHNENYFIKRPIKHGFFNLKNGEESIKSVARDLEKIIEYILIIKVNLKRS
jgi:hypothetical protein